MLVGKELQELLPVLIVSVAEGGTSPPHFPTCLCLGLRSCGEHVRNREVGPGALSPCKPYWYFRRAENVRGCGGVVRSLDRSLHYHSLKRLPVTRFLRDRCRIMILCSGDVRREKTDRGVAKQSENRRTGGEYIGRIHRHASMIETR